MKEDQNKLDYLDGLRGFAILLVVIFHYWQITWLNHSFTIFGSTIDLNFVAMSGFVGVEIFFFISGFCLYLPHARYTFFNRSLPSVSSFTYKRAIKILPSYYLSITLILIFSEINFKDTEQLLKTILSHIFFTNNIFTNLPRINGVFWSLAVEIQFYIIFPLIAFFFRTRPYLTFIILLITAISFRAYALNFDIEKTGYYLHQMPASLDLFACGMIAAHLSENIRSLCQKIILNPMFFILTTLCAIISLLLFIELMRWYYDNISLGGNTNIWQAYHRLSLGLTLIAITISGVFSHKIWQKIIANPTLLFLSIISYNLYIWHQLIGWYIYNNNIIKSSLDNPRDDLLWQLSVFSISLTISCFFATLLTYFFEKPLMKFKWRQFFRKKAL